MSELDSLPRVAVLATGGTIAGAADELGSAGYSSGVLGVDELVAAARAPFDDASLSVAMDPLGFHLPGDARVARLSRGCRLGRLILTSAKGADRLEQMTRDVASGVWGMLPSLVTPVPRHEAVPEKAAAPRPS